MDAACLRLGGQRRPAVLDQADLGGGAAHVERDQLPEAEQLPEIRAHERASGRSGLEQPHREPARDVHTRKAPARLHQIETAAEATCLQLTLEPAQVAVDEWLHVCVSDS